MRRARGFTLIEVVIAAGLLVVLCAGVAMVLMLTLNTIARSRHRAMALVLARAKLEQVLSEGSLPAEYIDYPDRYERRWTVARTGTGAAELLVVQVRVATMPARVDRDTIWIVGARLRRGR
jgi:Tfp pilus assembly protein PilV